MGLIETVQYINKEKVLKIVGENSEAAKQIEKLMTFSLPAREGEWIPMTGGDNFSFYKCSVCGYDNIVAPYFCECCGARLNRKEEEEEHGS